MQNPDPLIRIDLHGNVLKLNPAAEKLSGFNFNNRNYNATEFWHEISTQIHPEKEREIIEAKSGDKWYSFVIKSLTKDGYFNIYGRDVTDNKEKEDQLLILSSIAAQNTNGVVIADKDGKIEWANKSFEQITGYTIDELKGKKPGAVLQGKDSNPETIAYLKRQVNNGEPFISEILNYHKSGKPYWLRIQGQALKDKDGNVIKYFAIEEDITNEKETQQKLKEFESRFRIALEKLGDNVWEHDYLTGKTIFSNPFTHFLGYKFDEKTDNDKLWWDSIFKEDLNLLTENNEKIRNREIDHYALEYRMYHIDGSIKWVLDRGVVIEKDAYGKPLKIIGTHTDVTKQKNTEQALKLKEEKYRNIIANINLGLLEVDNDENIQYANQRFCTMSGFELDELLGRNASEIFIREENRKLIDNKNQLRKQNISDAYEIPAITKSGENKWWLISGAPNYNDRGELIGSIGIHLDITEQKRLELDLIEAKNNAETSSRLKESFLANMSHEIRTPLNAVIGMIREFSRETLSPKQTMLINNASRASQHLLSTLNDILDISKIESGQMVLSLRPFDLKEVILDSIAILAPSAQEKMLKISSEISQMLAPAYMGDSNRIRQVLLNIINNAIKFTDAGAVTIECIVAGVKNDTHLIKIKISDTGIGMDESFVKNIFDKFSQDDFSAARKYGGTGLGMTIVNELVNLMNGTISVTSSLSVGTSVEISLDLELANENEIQTKSTPESFNSLKDKNILLVEDNDLNRMVAENLLTYYGIRVSEAINGIEAIGKLKESTFDLILMDLQMPLMGGIEAAEIIRREMKLSIPIIALTANAFKAELDRCMAVGMNDYITKPYEENVLLEVILKCLPLTDTAPVIADEFLHKPKLYNFDHLFQFSRGNSEYVGKMIRIFVEQTPAAVEQIKEAWKSGDMKTIQEVSHKIKSNIDMFGIIDLKQEIRRIESLAKENLATPELEILIKRLDDIIKSVAEEIAKEKF
jgi:PAS domain S-box-containing protein